MKSVQNFTLVAGLRGDYNNLYGTFVTPRLHLKYGCHLSDTSNTTEWPLMKVSRICLMRNVR